MYRCIHRVYVYMHVPKENTKCLQFCAVVLGGHKAGTRLAHWLNLRQESMHVQTILFYKCHFANINELHSYKQVQANMRFKRGCTLSCTEIMAKCWCDTVDAFTCLPLPFRVHFLRNCAFQSVHAYVVTASGLRYRHASRSAP